MGRSDFSTFAWPPTATPMSSALASEGRRLLRSGGAVPGPPEARPFGAQPPWDAHLSRSGKPRGLRAAEEAPHRPRRPSQPQVVRLSSISEDEAQPAGGDPLQTGFADFESFFANSRQTRMLDVSGRARPHSYRGHAPAPRKRRLSVSSLASIEEDEGARPRAGRRAVGDSPADLCPSADDEDEGAESCAEDAGEMPQSLFYAGQRPRDDLSLPSSLDSSAASVTSQPTHRPRHASVAGRRSSPRTPVAPMVASAHRGDGGGGPVVSPLIVPGASPRLRPPHSSVDTTFAPPPGPGSAGTPTGAPASPGAVQSTPGRERYPGLARAPASVTSEQGSAGEEGGGRVSQRGSAGQDSLDLLLLPPTAPRRPQQSASRPTSRARPGDGLMAAARASLGSQRSRAADRPPPHRGPDGDVA